MVKKRDIFLLLLVLATLGILLTTFILKNRQFNALCRKIIHAQPPTDLPETAEAKECSDGTLMYEDYCVVSPFYNDTRNTSDAGLVTLCTQGTVEFLKHVTVLCHRWSNPISVAVYSPDGEYEDAQIMVHQLRRCDSCVRHWVKWHFFFPKETEVKTVDEFQLTKDCNFNSSVKGTNKRSSNATYPINVARNIARQFSSTHFLFSIDIELYPSLNIPSMFERLLQSQPINSDNQVWVLPVFEVFSNYRAPLVKSELRKMYKRKIAMSFHQYRCNMCHRIPNITQWMDQGVDSSSEVENSLEPLRVWTTVKRSRKLKLHRWEPFFIGTRKDPEFDVRLSWEGKQNKMQMAYEMCMRNYDFHIIENAFLVHTPGVHIHHNLSKGKEIMKQHVKENRRVIIQVTRKLLKEYGFKNDC